MDYLIVLEAFPLGLTWLRCCIERCFQETK